MTKANIKETTQSVVIPVAVALGLIALVAQSMGALPKGDSIESTLAMRIASIEARQVELDRQWREDRSQVLNLLMELRGDVRRIEGKLEK